jgi:twinkle protein
LWNEDCLREPSVGSELLIVTEGEIDALSFLAAGATCVVSVPNGAPFDKAGEGDVDPGEDGAFRYLWDGHNLKTDLHRFGKFILATDGDHKGRILRDELALRLGRPRCWFVTYPDGCKDANDVLQKFGQAKGCDLLNDLIAGAKPIVPNKLVSFSEIPPRVDDRRYSTGWGPAFHRHLMVVPPQLIIVTGPPQHGKTEWTLGLCANLARLHGLKGAILQFEDNPDRNRRVLLRYACAWAGQERGGIVGDPVAWVDAMFKTISPNEELNEEQDFDLKWLTAMIEEAAARHGCRWILIDPWNEIEHLWGRQDTEATYLNRALKHLKRLARRFQIALIIVAHPTKEGGKASIKEASLYDINGGAVWNNKADLGVIVRAEADEVTAPERWIKVAKSKDFHRFGIASR